MKEMFLSYENIELYMFCEYKYINNKVNDNLLVIPCTNINTKHIKYNCLFIDFNYNV